MMWSKWVKLRSWYTQRRQPTRVAIAADLTATCGAGLDHARMVTEDDYRAWVNWKMPRLAREITDRLHTAGVLPEDMHFEWTERPS